MLCYSLIIIIYGHLQPLCVFVALQLVSDTVLYLFVNEKIEHIIQMNYVLQFTCLI